LRLVFVTESILFFAPHAGVPKLPPQNMFAVRLITRIAARVSETLCESRLGVVYSGWDLVVERRAGGVLVTLPALQDPRRSCLYSVINVTQGTTNGLYSAAADIVSATTGRVLLLGLGGGSLPFEMAVRGLPNELIAVDASREALDVTRRFALADDGVTTCYVHARAEDFVDRPAPPGGYALVINDAFCRLVPVGNSVHFVRRVRELLAPGGTYVVNIVFPEDVGDAVKLVGSEFETVERHAVEGSSNTWVVCKLSKK